MRAASRHTVVDPRLGLTIDSVPMLTAGDVDGVVAESASAGLDWARRGPAERCRHVARLAAELERDLDAVAITFSREHGKTVPEAAAELRRAVETLRWAADSGPRILAPRPLADRGAVLRHLLAEPAGPVLAVVPWNFPALVLARKLGPALAAGCSVVVKGPEQTPGTVRAFTSAADRAGLPPNLVRIVLAGPDVTQALVGHPGIRHVSFTGSSRVGRLVAATAAAVPTACTLELGGHAPVVVTADADLDAAVPALAAAKFGSAGQSCTAPSRFLVARPRYAEFVDRLAAAAPALDRDVPSGGMGPLNSERRRAEVHDLVAEAVHRGARLIAGGAVPDGPGWYYPATVLSDVPPAAQVLHEEPFGPVAPVLAYDDIEEAVTLANSTSYALAAYVFGTGPETGYLAGCLDAGSVTINTTGGAVPDAPLGGRRASGYGYEGGDDGVLAFSRFKIVSRQA